MEPDLVIKGGTLVFPARGVEKANVSVKDGIVSGLHTPGATPKARRDIDASGLHVFPGVIDAHLHFGYAEPVEEYRTETTSAALGGVTTVLAYVVASGPYRPFFEQHERHASERALIDFGFHFTASDDVHIGELPSYSAQLGVPSLKYYMSFKGEAGRYMGINGTDDGFLYDLMEQAGREPGTVIVAHPENIEIVNRIKHRFMSEGLDGLGSYCASKPDFLETENIVRAMLFAEHFGATVYIPHLSCGSGVAEIARFRQRYQKVFVETCPHYLTHDLDTDLGAIGKANPPLRSRSDVEALWSALESGDIDVVASDHVPRKRVTKQTSSIWQASQGFPGTATLLPVLLNEGYHRRGLSLQRIAQLLCANPARIFGIPRKGDIAVGADADFTIVDLTRERTIEPGQLGSYSDYSPYEGWTLKGWPVATIVRGRTVMENQKIVSPPGWGAYVRRERAPSS